MGGIGVGAFEEVDDDIYDNEDRQQYDRVLTTANPVLGLRPTFRSRSHRQLALETRQHGFSGPSRFDLQGFVATKGQTVPRKVSVFPTPQKCSTLKRCLSLLIAINS